MNKVLHALVLVLFGGGCWFLSLIVEAAFKGSSNDAEVAFGSARAKRSTSLHPPLHGRRAASPRGFSPFGPNLLHLRVDAKGRASSAVDRLFGHDDVRASTGDAANPGGDLPPTR